MNAVAKENIYPKWLPKQKLTFDSQTIVQKSDK